MSTQATDFSAIERQMDEELKAAGIPVEAAPAEDKSQDDFTARFKALETELAALKALPQERYVGPEGEPVRQPQREAPQERSTGGPTPRKLTTEEYVRIAEKDPVKATQEALAAGWGLPEGTNPIVLIQALAAELQTHKAEIAATKQQTFDAQVYQAAATFMEHTPGYEASPENQATIWNYLQNYGLDPLKGGFKLAYTQAVADGVIEPKKTSRGRAGDDSDTDSTGGLQEPEVPRSRSRVPSLRKSTPSPEQSAASIQAKMERMDTATARKYWNQLVNSGFDK